MNEDEKQKPTPTPEIPGQDQIPPHDPSMAKDPFEDPRSYMVDNDISVEEDAEDVQLTVDIKKPHHELFIRTHPDPEYQKLVTLLMLSKQERGGKAAVGKEYYFVVPEMRKWSGFRGENALVVMRLIPYAIALETGITLWPIRTPDQFGNLDTWNTSATAIAKLAQTQWLRVLSSKPHGRYTARVAKDQTSRGEPKWPGLSYADLLRMAFQGRIIDSPNAPVLRRLDGSSVLVQGNLDA